EALRGRGRAGPRPAASHAGRRRLGAGAGRLPGRQARSQGRVDEGEGRRLAGRQPPAEVDRNGCRTAGRVDLEREQALGRYRRGPRAPLGPAGPAGPGSPPTPLWPRNSRSVRGEILLGVTECLRSWRVPTLFGGRWIAA